MFIYFIDSTGRTAFDLIDYQKARNFSDGLAAVESKDYFYGFINKKGEIVIKPKFYEVGDFSEGLAYVKTHEKSIFNADDNWAYIDKTGRIVIETDFDRLCSFSEGVAVATKDEEIFLIDKTGQTILSLNSDEIHIDVWDWENTRFSDGLILAFDRETEKRGFMDKTGKFVIEPKFKNASSFSEGLARISVIENGREMLGFINRKGEYVIPPKFDIDYDFLRCATDFSEGLASLIDEPPTTTKDSNFMYIDKTGQIILRTKFFRAEPFHEGLAVVWDSESNKNGFIDKSGKLVIPSEFDFASNFSEGLASVGQY